MVKIKLSHSCEGRTDFGLVYRGRLLFPLTQAAKRRNNFGFVYLHEGRFTLQKDTEELIELRLLAELMGNWEQAAGEHEAAGRYERAIECYRRADKLSEAGRLLENLRRYPEAADAYRGAGLPEKAAHCLVEAGKYEDAWALFRDSDPTKGAKTIYEHLQAEPRRTFPSQLCLEMAQILEKNGGLEPAANLYIRAGKPEKAAPLMRTLGKFDEAIRLYEEASDHLNLARLYESLARYGEAAAAYEEAAIHLQGRKAAQLLLAAAGSYARAGMKEKASAAEQKALELGGLPRVNVRLSSKRTLRLDEWDSLEIVLENRGYGLAKEVHIELTGPLSPPVSRGISELAAGARESLSVSIKPTEAGPRVPVTLKLSYIDPYGETCESSGEVYIKVLRPEEFQPPKVWQTLYQGPVYQGPVVEGDVGLLKQVSKPAEEPFRVCPYCGKPLNLPKTPRYCPYCGEQLM